VAIRQYNDVAEFHKSVIENRKLFLEQELEQVKLRLSNISKERSNLDQQRSEIMKLLDSSVALDTFGESQVLLSELASNVQILEEKLARSIEINQIDDRLRMVRDDAVISMRNELRERDVQVTRAISLFGKLGNEIYSDRTPILKIDISQNGILQIIPEIQADASTGIRGVEIFLLDIVCLISAIEYGRAPRLLMHDSRLFDGMDDRQAASCLNIGARLSEQMGFQYIVTMNSDKLSAIDKEGFDSSSYLLPIRLTDDTEDGGIFGFRF
jgi:uncharacterized protein YydD (DUF2326 family)